MKLSLITEYLLSQREKRKFVDQVGLAYVEAAEGNVSEARNICDKLIDRIELYKSNIGRLYYLLSCLALVTLILIFAYFLKKFKFIPEIIPHFYFMTYASLGGFFSVAKNIKKIQIDSGDFGWFQLVNGFIRILIAMFSGLIMYAVLKSDLVFSNIGGVEDYYVISALAIAAGFSESLIPNLFKISGQWKNSALITKTIQTD